MNTKNMKIIAVAAVVIALCLVFSYFYVDDGGDGVRDPAVGDIYQYEVTSVDAEGNTVEYTVTETIVMEADGQMTMSRLYDDGSVDYRVSETYNGIPEDAEITGSGTVNGHRCDIYTYTLDDEDGTTVSAWVDQGGVMRQMTESRNGGTITSVLTSTTVGDAPWEFGSCQVDENVMPGSYLAFEFQQDGETVPVTMLVEYADDETVVLRNSWSGNLVSIPTGTFVSGGEWGESVGTILLSTPYGDRLCSIHSEYHDGIMETVYLGIDDGVCYYISVVESDGTFYGGLLMSSTNVWSEDTSRAMTVGDYFVQQTTVVRGDGTEEQYASIGTVTAVEGPMLRVDVVDENMDEVTIYDYPYFQIPVESEYVGMELMDVGQFEGALCDVWSLTSGGTVITYWTDTETGLLLRSVVSADGLTATTDLIVSSQPGPVPEFGSNTVDRVPGLGDFYIFNSQEHGLFEMRITEESDGMVTYTCSLDGSQGTCTAEEFLSTGQFEGMQVAGVYLVSNPVYGDRVCIQYLMDGDEMQLIYVGADDGVCYRVETEDDVWTLMGSSFVYGDLEIDYSSEVSEGDVILLESDTLFDTGEEVYGLMEVEVLSVSDDVYTFQITYDGEVTETVEMERMTVLVGEPLSEFDYLCAYGKMPCTVYTATVNGQDAVVLIGDGTVFGISYAYEGYTIGLTVIAATFLNDSTSL